MLETTNDKMREEIKVLDKLIAERNRILDRLQCVIHGQCISHVLDWIEKAEKVCIAAEAYKKEMNGVKVLMKDHPNFIERICALDKALLAWKEVR